VSTSYDAFVLVSFGGPEKPEDVMPFLERVSAGRRIPEQRLRAVAEHYYAAGGASPLPARCRELLELLQPGMAALGLPVYWGNRNWHPLLEDTLAELAGAGASRVVAFVTSAYGGYSSCRQYLEDIALARAKVGPKAPEVDKLRLFYNHPGWVAAWARSLSAALAQLGEDARGRAQVLFSAHSVPVVAAESSPYEQHVQETARLVAAGAGVASWQVVWQSRSGNPAQPWLGPDVTDVIAASGAESVVVVPIGFAVENMEVVHDLDVEAAQAANRAGKGFLRAECVSGYPEFVQMVLQLVRERSVAGEPRLALGAGGPWPDVCPAGHCPPPERSRS
jgi:ferrochelatase